MSIYDDQTKEIVKSDGRLLLPIFKECSEATFKASYVVASDIKCTGKITALFNLTVLGNLEAKELDVKGRFICTGKCSIDGALIVQNDIWAEDIQAEVIESHDRIFAQTIDASTVHAGGDIIVGRILAIEKLAQSGNNIICGETAYGAGRVAANTVITGEPIDLDDGMDAVVSPNSYSPIESAASSDSQMKDVVNINHIPDFASSGDWSGYLDWLIINSTVTSEKTRFSDWKNILSKVEGIIRNKNIELNDLSLLIWTTGIVSSDYFSGWTQAHDLLNAINKRFASVVNTDKKNISCSLESYSELLQALDILSQYGGSMDSKVYGLAFGMLISNFGLKAKFVTERLNEKGWKAHGEQQRNIGEQHN